MVFHETVFSILIVRFFANNLNFFRFRKKIVEERVTVGKKRFQSIKKLFKQIFWAEKMPRVIGHLTFFRCELEPDIFFIPIISYQRIAFSFLGLP